MSILSILLMNIHFIYVCINASWFHCFWNSKEYVDKTEAIRQEHKRTSIWSKQRISPWRIQVLFGCQWTLWYNSVIKWRNKILLDKTRYILSGLSFTFLIPDTRIWNYKVYWTKFHLSRCLLLQEIMKKSQTWFETHSYLEFTSISTRIRGREDGFVFRSLHV